MAALSLGVAPADCVVIEDAPAGIEAARSAGISVIALTTTHRHEELPADAHAASLAGIHVGRIEQDSNRPRLIELLVS